MNIDNILQNQKIYNSKLDVRLNFYSIGIFLFTLCFSTLYTFASSHLLELVLLFFSCVFLLFAGLKINKKRVFISKIDILWFLFLVYFILNIWFKGINLIDVVDIIVYVSCVFFLLIVKVDISYYKSAFNLIKFLSIIYALSAIFQYYFTDLYMTYFFPFFSIKEQTSILYLLSRNSYTGFTSQTAYLAGYIVSGIGIILFSDWKKKLLTKFASAFFIIILFLGLLLTTKRAHLIFMIIAIFITYLFSVKNKEFIRRVMKLFIGLIVIVFISLVLINHNDEESLLAGFIVETENTINGVMQGEDVTSGRIVLYKYSLQMFEEEPIFGIGWREFIKNSSGLINKDKGSHPHNIYIQLLTEFGIIGFLFFIIPVLIIYINTYRILRILSNKNNLADKFLNWKAGIQVSLFLQTFFILYGLTGNLLTDHNFLLTYFFACAISLSAMFKLKLYII